MPQPVIIMLHAFQVVIPAPGLVDPWSSAKLAHCNHECVVEHAALLEVGDELVNDVVQIRDYHLVNLIVNTWLSQGIPLATITNGAPFSTKCRDSSVCSPNVPGP